MNRALKYLAKILPGFESKPKTAKAAKPLALVPSKPVAPAPANASPKPAIPTPATQAMPTLPAPRMMAEIVSFLRRYLVCDEDQFTVLALWIVHTWCFRVFSTTPYLDIRSQGSQSGKTVCLKLLDMLCASSALITGAASKTLMQRLLKGRAVDKLIADGRISPAEPFTILLDDCHHTFNLSERQPLLALINSGVEAGCFYAAGNIDYYFFGPKAFAGNSRLPHSLATRCIPVLLRRKKTTDVVNRIDGEAARPEAARLAEAIRRWCADNATTLKQAARKTPRLASFLTPREQAWAEPLFTIADVIGEIWPDKARSAVKEICRLTEDNLSVELLWDVRGVFLQQQDPGHITTKDLLAGLSSLEHRPWASWTSRSGLKLAGLLRPFRIRSRNLEVGDGKQLKGYLRSSFEDAWERYVTPIPIGGGTSGPAKTN